MSCPPAPSTHSTHCHSSSCTSRCSSGWGGAVQREITVRARERLMVGAAACTALQLVAAVHCSWMQCTPPGRPPLLCNSTHLYQPTRLSIQLHVHWVTFQCSLQLIAFCSEHVCAVRSVQSAADMAVCIYVQCAVFAVLNVAAEKCAVCS